MSEKPPEHVDRVGIIASSVCAVHCVVCALAPAAFAAMGVGFFANPLIEWGLTIIAGAFAALTLVVGWPRHRSRMVAMFLVLGIAGLLASRGVEMSSGHHHEHGHHDTHESHEHGEHAHEKEGGHEHGAHHEQKHHDDVHGDHHDHDDHHNAGHDAHAHHDDHDSHQEHGHNEHEEAAAHDDHDDASHMLGGLIGVLAGIFLLIGHILSIVMTRRCC